MQTVCGEEIKKKNPNKVLKFIIVVFKISIECHKSPPLVHYS